MGRMPHALVILVVTEAYSPTVSYQKHVCFFLPTSYQTCLYFAHDRFSGIGSALAPAASSGIFIGQEVAEK